MQRKIAGLSLFIILKSIRRGPRPLKEKNSLSRFAFSVSKKVSSKAVTRNKYRREGYAVLSKYLNRVKDGHICLFSFKNINELSFGILEKEILELLGLSGVIL